MNGAGLLVAALAVAFVVALLRLGVALAKAADRHPPEPPRPTPPIHPTWADIHRRTAGTSADEYLIVRTPRAVHCIYLPRETDRFIESIYAQADQEKS